MVERKEVSHTRASEVVANNGVVADDELVDKSEPDNKKDGEHDREEQNTSCVW